MWKAILAALVIFGAGVMTGGLLVWGTSARRPAQPPRQWVVNASPFQAQLRAFLNRLDRELTLTPDQRQQIEAVITARQQKTRDLWEPVAERMGEELKQAREEILGALTVQQRKKFEALAKSKPSRKTESASPQPERRSREERRSSPATNPPASATNRI